MWEIIEFKTASKQLAWYEKNKNKYQITEIFINNSYAYEYKKLITL